MTPRTDIAQARRVVVKVGSSSLASATGGLDAGRVDALVDGVAERHAQGGDLVVVSSGAIAAGLLPLRLRRRPRDLATQQAAASVGQGLLVQSYAASFARYGTTVAQVLLTAEDVVRRAHYRNARRALERLLHLRVVPVVNENDAVATDEIRFGDNDRLAALVAHLVHADALVLLSDVDGLYDGDPARPGARLIAVVGGEADLPDIGPGRAGPAAVGTGGMASKIDAARVATGAGIPVVLAHAGAVRPALAGDPVGTYFAPTGRRTTSRLLWLAHASAPNGRLLLDAGAVRAVVLRRASLLPAGVTGVEGEFAAGDPVELVGPDGRAVARGMVAYDAAELPAMLGRSTGELGPDQQRELVHRDDLVLLT
jgi:glutamate 5-kinase